MVTHARICYCETTDKVGGAICKVGGAVDILFGKTEFGSGSLHYRATIECVYRNRHVQRLIDGSIHDSRYMKLHQMYGVYKITIIIITSFILVGKPFSCIECHRNERRNGFVISYQTYLHVRTGCDTCR